MMGTIGQLSHMAAALAFAMLGLALAIKRSPSGVRLAVALASFLTAFWAVGQVIAGLYGADSFPWLSRLETIRSAAWIGVLLLLQRRSLGLASSPHQSFAVALGLGFVIALQLALDVMFQVGANALPLSEQHPGALLFVALRLVLAISGLVLLHNLYVNSGNDGGISFRLFAVGLGVIFAYDLNLYTLHFLIGEPNLSLLEIRGAVNALAAPLIYLALRQDGGGRFHLSRQAAFQTVSFSMIGLYLIAMSILAYGLKMTGGNWGQLLQVTFLAVTLIAGALVVLSPRFRAELKVRIARNFYRYRYDYRVEWLRFIEKIDAQPGVAGQAPFRERLIEAVATVLDCPGGALLEPSDAGGYELSSRWGWPSLDAPHIADSSAILLFFHESGRIADFDQLRREAASANGGPGSHGLLKLPQWAAADRAIWLGVPLIHREKLIAILLLERSLAARDLNWEDFDLLRTLGRQGASYLAEAETQAQLDEARSFDEYNRRFAFVMHDVKNVVSQLGLVARNAERHADKPEFRADMIATLNGSVAKMTDLLKLMGRENDGRAGGGAGDGAMGEADVARILTMVAASVRRQHAALELEGAELPAPVAGDASRLEAMLTHLVQNAVDASAPEALIRLSLERVGAQFRISVADSGHGMSRSFIRDELFKPFRSTKDGGFGIGAFEAREIARAHGGRLEVESRPGEGSRFTIYLPALPESGQGIRHRVHPA
ncbi:PEP-CTERM system histidine kinase PrsK [Sandaracinobacter sp. RS1-74]|uniref:XrtA/PEP-CTERM system histidine kinase PrsK n=1 Tax=Sandaracinobacteroides sayramensis TaxID=2913411 RepID=UPI001EDAB3DE|nr:XrtA/PEP-CTERM system histidine kinase PrsK [Sandaracinobacteroides sayramensis]MCG2839863.1 PEP-CTERM system histidine kinase PrsK [Sandaracinobacteroides sayramensis]